MNRSVDAASPDQQLQLPASVSWPAVSLPFGGADPLLTTARDGGRRCPTTVWRPARAAASEQDHQQGAVGPDGTRRVTTPIVVLSVTAVLHRRHREPRVGADGSVTLCLVGGCLWSAAGWFGLGGVVVFGLVDGRGSAAEPRRRALT